MQTFLITSVNKSFIKSEIKKISKNLQVSPYNLIEITPDKSIGIAEVRKLTQQIILKPYGGGDRMIIINSIEKATPEAGNALLKLLEEPPENTYIFLTCENMNKLLPTITSRCQIIFGENESTKSSPIKLNSKKLLEQILRSSAGERILISQKITDSKESTDNFLSSLLITLEELLHNNDPKIGLTFKEIADLLSKVSIARNYIERNINFKATLDILLLGFPMKEHQE